MRLSRFFKSSFLRFFVTIISGIFIVSITGYLTKTMSYGIVALICFIIMLMYALGTLYYYIRPPIKIKIIRYSDCDNSLSKNLEDYGKPCIKFYVENFGDGDSLDPIINLSYLTYERKGNKIQDRLKKNKKRFKLKYNDVKEWSIPPNEPKEFLAVCTEKIHNQLMMIYPIFKFSFNGGGCRRQLSINTIQDGNVGLLKFLSSLVKYILFNRLDFLDKTT